MFYIIALGNPGEKYAKTRHNVAWQAMDYLIDSLNLPGLVESKSHSGRITEGVIENEEVIVLYPDTFMNNSGSAVVKLVSKDDSEKMIVVHDDIDLPFGEIRVGRGRGAGGNNGVRSVIEKLGTKDFIRVRIGIAPKSVWTGEVKRPAGGGPLERFVLKPFGLTESRHLIELFKQVQKTIEIIVSEGVESAMNKIN